MHRAKCPGFPVRSTKGVSWDGGKGGMGASYKHMKQKRGMSSEKVGTHMGREGSMWKCQALCG